jgi:excisionase family DNA binding protein
MLLQNGTLWQGEREAEIETKDVVINPPVLNAQQACTYLGGISRRTLTNLVDRGELTSVRVFRRLLFRRTDLDRLARLGTRVRSGRNAN